MYLPLGASLSLYAFVIILILTSFFRPSFYNFLFTKMPKHTRASSSNQNRYSNPLPVTLAPSAMPVYGTTTRSAALPLNTNLNTSYYNAVPHSATVPVSMPAQGYEQYAPAVATQPPPMPHRPSSGAWSQQDDQNLLTARQQGLNWAQIQSRYFPNKSPNACRKRHERLLERRGADDWDARKLEQLAKDYMSMRREIWQGLAARTGEKWSVVEAKVCSSSPFFPFFFSSNPNPPFPHTHTIPQAIYKELED